MYICIYMYIYTYILYNIYVKLLKPNMYMYNRKRIKLKTS